MINNIFFILVIYNNLLNDFILSFIYHLKNITHNLLIKYFLFNLLIHFHILYLNVQYLIILIILMLLLFYLYI